MQNLSASSRIYLGSRNHIYIYIYIITVKLTSISFPLSVQNAVYYHDICRHYYDYYY